MPEGEFRQWLIKLLLDFVLIGLVALVLSFPIVFRAEVRSEDERKNERRIRRIIIYSYSFAALSLVGSVLPFVVFPHVAPNLYKAMLNSPVGIVLGCSEAEEKKPVSESPPPAAPPKPAATTKQLVEGAVPQVATHKPQTQLTGSLDRPPKEIDCAIASEQWVINIGGMTLPPAGQPSDAVSMIREGNIPKFGAVRIQGGLVVPLYFIVLALIGGAVSLTRRVPEYQKRYSNQYVPVEGKPRLDRATVREYLAFQILQFLSAPLLAAVAYYAFAPQSRASLVALGFAAGFSSEAVLLMIRALVEKLAPAKDAAPQTGSVSGTIFSTTTDASGISTPVITSGAKVSVVGKPTLTAQTDNKGFFVINGIAPGDCILEVSSADAKKKGTTKVIIEAGKTTACHIEIA
jgi:hypothetical protein